MSRDGSYELIETIISSPFEGVQCEPLLFLVQHIITVKPGDVFGITSEMQPQILIYVNLVLVLARLLLEEVT